MIMLATPELGGLPYAVSGLAASAFVPAMVLGIFWRGATRAGAVAGMLAGLGVAVYYQLAHSAALRLLLGLADAGPLWWGIQPISADVFGVTVGVAAVWLASVLAPRGAAARSRSP